MKCPRCQQENPARAKLCVECAALVGGPGRAPRFASPRAYTPKHLAERIVDSKRADKLYEPRFQIGLEVMKSLPYNRWRESDAEDTLRFHALRLHQVGMIKTNPSKLVAQSTNWRFLNELKKELKG
jgi:hypothetical protein